MDSSLHVAVPYQMLISVVPNIEQLSQCCTGGESTWWADFGMNLSHTHTCLLFKHYATFTD